MSGLCEAYQFHDVVLHPSASMGLAEAPKHGTDTRVLMKLADTALYEVKRSGRAAWKLFGADGVKAPEPQQARSLRQPQAKHAMLTHPVRS
jgi:predicted signal transduction protein with EAL and GGDEF domain